MKIKIEVEDGRWSGGEYHRYAGEYDNVLAAEAGLRVLAEKFQRNHLEPDRGPADNEGGMIETQVEFSDEPDEE